MSEALREIKRLFPDSTITTDDGDLEYFFEPDEHGTETLIIRTPDRSKAAQLAVKGLKTSGLSGVWRSRADTK